MKREGRVSPTVDVKSSAQCHPYLVSEETSRNEIVENLKIEE
jgi:hypothetical protein